MDRDSAGSARSRPTTCSSHGEADAPRRHRRGRRCEAAYERDETDEFIAPTIGRRRGDASAPATRVLAFNFRPDRMRQITRALAEPGFDEIDRDGRRAIERYATLTEYEEDWAYPVAFPPRAARR